MADKILSAKQYGQLQGHTRRVVRLEDFTDDEMALIAKAEVPAEFANLDDELKDRKEK